MNLKFLGDALDFWKGSLLERLQRRQLLVELAVDAMASDRAHWVKSDWGQYASLLQMRPERIIHHEEDLGKDRDAYFKELCHEGDIFLDPDTGITTKRVDPKHLAPSELHEILRRHPSRVAAVYQHASRTHIRERLEEIMSRLRRSDHPFCACSYESSAVAMLFFSEDRDRVCAIYSYFRELFGHRADQRTNVWPVGACGRPRA